MGWKKGLVIVGYVATALVGALGLYVALGHLYVALLISAWFVAGKTD